MSFKLFLISIYSFAGLMIAAFSAFMTYLIIGEPIGMKMFSKIALSVLLAMPVIGFISYRIGNYFFSKFEDITKRLDAVSNEDFERVESNEKIDELAHIHHSINRVAARLSEVINNLKHHNKTMANMGVSFAHDVKTPLMIIDGYLEELQDGLIETSTAVEKLKHESGYINDLSSDMLEYLGSLQSGRIREELMVKQYVQECIELIPISPNVRWNITVPDDFTIVFNPMDFKKVCINLLHNSAKFTEEGEISLYCIGNSIVFEDTGSGIDPSLLDQILDPFITADASKNRQKSGLGVGLSIALNLARNNGYALCIDKCIKNGTRIILSTSKKLQFPLF